MRPLPYQLLPLAAALALLVTMLTAEIVFHVRTIIFARERVHSSPALQTPSRSATDPPPKVIAGRWLATMLAESGALPITTVPSTPTHPASPNLRFLAPQTLSPRNHSRPSPATVRARQASLALAATAHSAQRRATVPQPAFALSPAYRMHTLLWDRMQLRTASATLALSEIIRAVHFALNTDTAQAEKASWRAHRHLRRLDLNAKAPTTAGPAAPDSQTPAPRAQPTPSATSSGQGNALFIALHLAHACSMLAIAMWDLLAM